VKGVGSIPRAGKNLIIVANLDHVLYFRIFDGDGDLVVDTNEKRLSAQSQQIADLRKELESLWPLEKLTESEKVRVIAAVTSIVEHERPEGQRVILPVLYERATGKDKKTSAKDKQKNTDLDELPILPALYEKASSKKKQQNADLDELS
jgi:hypothetical protein